MKKLFRVMFVSCVAIALPLGMTGCSATNAKETARAKKSDQDLIQGTWKAKSGERWVFTSETVSRQTVGAIKSTSKFRLDPSKKPKAIDLTAMEGIEKGQTIEGIYAIDGDTLKICWASDERAGRPDDFEESLGSTAIELKRPKP